MSEASRYESVDAEGASALCTSKGWTLLDVRTPEEYAAGHAPGAQNIPWMVQTAEGRQHNEKFLEQVRQAFPDTGARLVVTCGGGTRGTSAATAIADAGYAATACMPGGMKAWSARGLPTTAE